MKSDLPLHIQLERALKAGIAGGYWKAEQKIPSERSLMGLANVSRGTVRQAIESLIQQGVLHRVHGSGTYVTLPRLEQEMNMIYSFSEQIKNLGLPYKDHLLNRDIVLSTPELDDLLETPPETKLIYMERVRVLQGTPLMINRSYIPAYLCPDLLTTELDLPLYQLLHARFDLPVLRLTDVLECVLADSTMAHYLHIQKGAPLIHVTRTAYTRNHVPLQVGRNFIRADMCRFRINLSSKPDATELTVVNDEPHSG
jgi:GntR family transcriptional regulator